MKKSTTKKKLSLKQQLKLSLDYNIHLLASTIEMVRCSIGDEMNHYVMNQGENFKYDKENITSMFNQIESNMVWYKQQIETCCRNGFNNSPQADDVVDIIWQHGATDYIAIMKKGLLRKASRLKAKETLQKTKKGNTNAPGIRPRTKR